MDQVTLRNFRCFREKQTARLAPLTLLVGENGTGKTSLLAMIRALWDAAYSHRVPDFKEDPYDLGSFDEIAHYRGGRGGRADSFEGEFDVTPRIAPRHKGRERGYGQPYRFELAFKKGETVPAPAKIRISRKGVWFQFSLEDQSWRESYGTPGGAWMPRDSSFGRLNAGFFSQMLPGFFYPKQQMTASGTAKESETICLQGTGPPDDEDWKLIHHLVDSHTQVDFGYYGRRPYANAPVRTKPRRTYDPGRTTRDPEGDYVPMYLGYVYSESNEEWKALKNALENFGQTAGLFDEISIKPLGNNASGPFQVQIRKYGKKAKGPQRNLIDVGYGVSQVLPVVMELLRPQATSMFLLQQPEAHLHPSAQAVLGSLFCGVAAMGRQLIVETHSDHLLDRVRMDVRDGATPLKPEDVSILFFERGDLDVRIHSLRVDQEGNMLDAPSSYRRFFTGSLGRGFKVFMEEQLIDDPRGKVYSTLKHKSFQPSHEKLLRANLCGTSGS